MPDSSSVATNPPMTVRTHVQPKQLHERLIQATKKGLETQSLVPLSTTYTHLEDQGTAFVVRTLQNIQKKEATRAIQVANKEAPRPAFNPFLPYEPNLFVGDICETHAVVLNKFKVVDHHALIITRDFQSQLDYLTHDDWVALLLCLEGLDGLAFFNGGEEAGASQPHKHLQFVPLPMTPEAPEPRLPIEPLMSDLPQQPNLNPVGTFPFVHAAVSMAHTWKLTSKERASHWTNTYNKLLQLTHLWKPSATQPTPQGRQQAPYNMLATREWMMLVPRRCEFYESISVNSLGFVGALLVKHEEAMNTLQRKGPWNLLHHVGVPKEEG